MPYQAAKNWYLAQFKPNCADIAQRNLVRQGYEVFLPRENSTSPQASRFVARQRPLFPGYLFVAFAAQEGRWRNVLSTAGITRLVSFGQSPAVVPDGVVAAIRQRCDADGLLLPPAALAKGDKVAVVSGPFADKLAEVLSCSADRRVWVLMEMMGGPVRVIVGMDELRSA